MATATFTLDADTRQAQAKIDSLLKKNYRLNFDTGSISQPLGRITAQVSEFDKSLGAANARVVAFGASATAVYGIQKAMSSLVSSTIEVQKSLTDINVILGASQASLEKFGGSLFNVAKNTGQSFSVVAEAATEFSRQGLSMEETLKRTNDALVLSRLSGLGAVKSVEALTAAINSFSTAGLTSTEIINKMANVDAAFSVSSKDLAEAISRVGASAAQSGVSIDELIALVTSAQQVTARGGAVIGNSLKTIFTRLERPKVQGLLESLGIQTTDNGQIKSTIQLLQDLANVYPQLGSAQKAAVAEQVGGVFQINILKAALADLGREQSIYKNALDVSLSSTDQAIQRNEQLNKTYAAQLNALKENATQLAATVGKSVFGPSIENVLGIGNSVLGSLNNIDTTSVGAKLGQGLLSGIGQIIAGPGLALITGVLLKLTKDFVKFSSESAKDLLGLKESAKQQEAIQKSINSMLADNPKFYKAILDGSVSVTQGAKALLGILEKQTLEMQQQQRISAQIASSMYGGGVRMGTGALTGIPVTRKSSGYIPEFAAEESEARMLGARNPKAEWSKGTIGGKRFIKNSEETEIVGYGSNGDSAVIPKYNRGYIPNFAGWGIASGISFNGSLENALIRAREIVATKSSKFGNTKLTPEIRAQAQEFIEQKGLLSSKSQEVQNPIGGQVYSSLDEYAAIVGNGRGNSFDEPRFRPSSVKRGYPAHIKFTAYSAKTKPDSQAESMLENILKQHLQAAKIDVTQQYVNSFGGKIKMPSQSRSVATNKYLGQIGALSGFIFEDVVASLLGSSEFNAYSSISGRSAFDFPNSRGMQLMFGVPESIKAVEAKREASANLMINPQNESSVASKIYSVIPKAVGKVRQALEIKNAASGYIPSFADALHQSIAREIGAGVSADDVYVKKYGQLANENNPEGLGVFNKRDEGTSGREMSAMRRRGYARGYIPNFAEDDTSPATASANSSTISQLIPALANLGVTLVLLKGSTDSATKALIEEYQQKLTSAKASQEAAQQLVNEASAKKQAFAASVQTVESARAEKMAEQELSTARQMLLAETKNLRAVEATNPNTLAAKAGRNVMGIGMAAPIIAQTASQFIPQTSAGGRGASATLGAIGNITSMAATGLVVSGGNPLGAAIGGAVAAAAEIPKVVDAFTDKVPDLEAAVQRLTDKFNQASGAGQGYREATQRLEDARQSGASPEAIARLQGQQEEALGKYSPEYQKRIMTASISGGPVAAMNESVKVEKDIAAEKQKQQTDINFLNDMKAISVGSISGRMNKSDQQLLNSDIIKIISGNKTGEEKTRALTDFQQAMAKEMGKSGANARSISLALESQLTNAGASKDVAEAIGNKTREIGLASNRETRKDLFKNIISDVNDFIDKSQTMAAVENRRLEEAKKDAEEQAQAVKKGQEEASAAIAKNKEYLNQWILSLNVSNQSITDSIKRNIILGETRSSNARALSLAQTQSSQNIAEAIAGNQSQAYIGFGQNVKNQEIENTYQNAVGSSMANLKTSITDMLSGAMGLNITPANDASTNYGLASGTVFDKQTGLKYIDTKSKSAGGMIQMVGMDEKARQKSLPELQEKVFSSLLNSDKKLTSESIDAGIQKLKPEFEKQYGDSQKATAALLQLGEAARASLLAQQQALEVQKQQKDLLALQTRENNIKQMIDVFQKTLGGIESFKTGKKITEGPLGEAMLNMRNIQKEAEQNASEANRGISARKDYSQQLSRSAIDLYKNITQNITGGMPLNAALDANKIGMTTYSAERTPYGQTVTGKKQSLFDVMKQGVVSFDTEQMQENLKFAEEKGDVDKQATYAAYEQIGLGRENKKTGKFEINKQAIDLEAELKVRKETGLLTQGDQADIMARMAQFQPANQGKSLEQIKVERANQGTLYENQAANQTLVGTQAAVLGQKSMGTLGQDVANIAKMGKTGEGNETITALTILNTYQAKSLEFLSQIATNTSTEKNKNAVEGQMGLVNQENKNAQTSGQSKSTEQAKQGAQKKEQSAVNVSPNINVTVNAGGGGGEDKYSQATPQLVEEIKKTVESFYVRLDKLEQRADNGKLPAAPPASSSTSRSDVEMVYANQGW